MKRKLVIVLPIILLGLLYLYISKDFTRTSSTLYLNGDVITMEENQPAAEAVYVEDGIIVAIGSNSDLDKYKSSASKIIDLKGQTLLPGFIDPHTHPALSSFFSDMVDLSGFKHKTNVSIWNHLKDEAKKVPAGEWILCKGLDPVLVADLETPSISFLDSIAPNNPIMIMAQSIHSFWANSVAFSEVGIDKNTPDPSEASYYEKDENGELTGFFTEQEALQPFREKITEIQSDRLIDQSVRALKDYARNGNTTIVALGLTGYEQRILDFYQFLSGETTGFLNKLLSKVNILPKREPMVRHMVYIRFDATDLLPASVDNGDDHFKVLGVKFWYDGAPYTGSMYLEEPYLESDFNHDKLHIAHNHRGESLMSPEALAAEIKKYEDAGWQIAIHSQGDQSTKEVMEAFDRVTDVNKDNRHRIEHCLMIQREALAEMNRMRIQPSFHINHLYYYGQALQEDILGPERTEDILPIGIAEDFGLTYTLHSDAPMFPSEPLSLIQTAVTRQTKEGNQIGAAQAISVRHALESLTINAAWQIKMEDKLGSIKVGKYADLVVLDGNPMKIDPYQLRGIQVMRTVVGGEDVYVRH